MKKQKTIYLLNEADLEVQIQTAMEELDMDKASMLLDDIAIDETALDPMYIQDIKERTFKKIGLFDMAAVDYDNNTEVIKKEHAGKRKHLRGRRYIACAAVIILIFLAGMKHESIVLAFQQMLSLIPGVGIVENNQGAVYRLKEQVTAENDLSTLKILYVTATADTLTVRFELEGNFTKDQELERKKKKEIFNKLDVYLLVNDLKFQKYHGGSGVGISGSHYSYSCDYTFEVDQKYINEKKEFILVSEENDIRVSFRLSKIDQYGSLNEIGATEIHNDISLTASSFLKDGQLSVNVYPINNSDYDLISFNNEYDLEYFGRKMFLNTDKGIKKYTPPSYYGTGLNGSFLFDVSDGSGDFKLSIPFVVVETEEIKKINLPIPEEGEVIEVNKEINFESGSAVIQSVERLRGDIGNENGYLKILLEYTSLNENKQLVSVEFTGKDAIGFYPYRDDQNRTTAVSYMLNEFDTKELKLSVTRPRYVLMEPYELDISIE